MCVEASFLFLKFYQSEEYLEKSYGQSNFYGQEKTLLFSLLLLPSTYFFPFVCFYLQSSLVTEKVTRSCACSLHWAYFCAYKYSYDVREINTKERDAVFQIFPTRVMHLEMWVKTSNSWISSPFYDLKEWIRITPAYIPVFPHWSAPCQDDIGYDIIRLKKVSV